MTRVSMITTALVIGLLAGSAASARANGKDKKDNKDKGHKFIGLSPVDFPHHGDKHHGDKDCKGHDGCDKDRCNGNDHCGKDNCDDDSCHHGSKPPKENMGGSTNHPPGTPGGNPLPSKPLPLAWRYLGKNGVKDLLGMTSVSPPKTPIHTPLKGLHNLLGASKPAQGQITTLGSGVNGFASAVGKDVGSAVGLGVTEAIKGVGAVTNAVGDVAVGVGNAVSDLASGVGNALESIF